MAVAARPGASDARVPCPLCGGLIHPIAGKCKHCKADVTAYQAARPAASAPLPALHRPSINGHAEQANGQPAHGAIAIAVVAAEAQPILPPRPSARSQTAEPAHSAWRSWPVLVIVVAMIAIVAAVVLMLWPASSSRAGDSRKRALQPPPAPERMPTTMPDLAPRTPDRPNHAAPRATAPDPWGPAPAPPDPGKADPDDDDDVSGPSGSPHAARRGLQVKPAGALLATMVVHLCRKMVECGIEDPLMTGQCDRLGRVAPPSPANCPAAGRCLQHIDAMTCQTPPAMLQHIDALLTQFSDCHDALRC